MSRFPAVRTSFHRLGPVAGGWTPPSTARLLAVGFGLLLTGAYASVFYHLADVAGGVRWLALTVGAALVVATVTGRATSVGGSLVVGALLLVAGVVAYLAMVPELHADLLTVDFVRRWLAYLTGNSVLGFRRVGVWAVAVAPGPIFVSWSMLLHRHYDAATLVGAAAIGFFAMTGDAGSTTTLLGTTGALGLVGAGSVDRGAGTLGDVARVGFLLAIAVVLTRSLRVVPGAGAVGTVGPGSGDGGTDSPALEPPFEGDLANADDQAHIYESISLSPRVLFTIEADEAAYWRVGAYDRYTGADWIRTGGRSAYTGPLAPPVGPTRRIEQWVTAETDVGVLPAAWKPVAIDGVDPDQLQVTDLADLTPAEGLPSGAEYTVTSAVPERRADRLAETGTDYPTSVRDRYLQLPESTAGRVHDLAASLSAGAASPYDAAETARRWLASEKGYDLSVEHPGGDVVESFLFAMDRGYCVHFASSMVVLLRSMGIPARYVLGFTTGQPVGEQRWVVRGLDSHAWAEGYFPETGWIQFDPTPGTDRRLNRQLFVETARAEGLEGVDTNESSSAAGRTADELFDEAVDEPTADTPTTDESGNDTTATTPSDRTRSDSGAASDADGGSAPTAAVDAVEEWVDGRDRLSLLAGAVGLSLGLHWVGAFDRGARAIRLRWQRPTDSPRHDVERAYERLELLLADRFRPRRAAETRREYLRNAETVADVEGARRVLVLSERASYGGAVGREQADAAIRIVDELVEGDREGRAGDSSPPRPRGSSR